MVHDAVHPAPSFWKRAWLPVSLSWVPALMLLASRAHADRGIWIAMFTLPALVLSFLGVDQGSTLGLRILLHDDGLVVERRRGKEVVLFDDVDELRFRAQIVAVLGLRGSTHIYVARIVRHDGSECDVPLGVEDAARLTQIVIRRCSIHLLPEARAALRVGKTLHFGKVHLEHGGLSLHGSRYAWDDLRCVRLTPRCLLLVFRSWSRTSKALRLEALPHPHVLIALLRELCPCFEIERSLLVDAAERS